MKVTLSFQRMGWKHHLTIFPRVFVRKLIDRGALPPSRFSVEQKTIGQFLGQLWIHGNLWNPWIPELDGKIYNFTGFTHGLPMVYALERSIFGVNNLWCLRDFPLQSMDRTGDLSQPSGEPWGVWDTSGWTVSKPLAMGTKNGDAAWCVFFHSVSKCGCNHCNPINSSKFP